ncbi:MAG: hypothetical protein LBQ14_05455 [Treponema sp.]|nr:hypothetical protein [Treponema sp.]
MRNARITLGVSAGALVVPAALLVSLENQPAVWAGAGLLAVYMVLNTAIVTA